MKNTSYPVFRPLLNYVFFPFSRISQESRRQSIDSQLSAALGEFTAGRKAGSTPVPPFTSLGVSGGRVKPRHKRKKHQGKRSRIGLYSRRGSTTSQESQLGAQVNSSSYFQDYVWYS